MAKQKTRQLARFFITAESTLAIQVQPLTLNPTLPYVLLSLCVPVGTIVPFQFAAV